MNYFIAFIFSAALLLSSCSNEVPINASYKRITYIFGLLDQTQNTHYVRISKAFLGEGNALAFAQIFDSLYYKPTELQVFVEEYKNGNITRQLNLRDTIIPKNPGTFHNPDQQIWYFKANLDVNATYRIVVRNLIDGQISFAQTDLVKGMNLQNPSNLSSSISYLPSTLQYIYRWTTGVNGRLHEVLATFPIGEKNTITGDSTVVNLVWNLGRLRSNTADGGSTMTLIIPNREFFQFMKANLNEVNELGPNQNLKRYLNKVTITLNAAAEDYTTYLDVSQPSNTVAQERPTFNNITNGYGLFSSRTSINRQLNIPLQLVDSLRVNPLTEYLGF